MEIAPRQKFSASYNRLLDVSLDVYIIRIMVKEEMAYYATTQEGSVVLTSEEKAIRKAVTDEQLNVPQPIYAMLSEIGKYTDKMGKETHQVPNLPTTVVQGFGGYHANAIVTISSKKFPLYG